MGVVFLEPNKSTAEDEERESLEQQQQQQEEEASSSSVLLELELELDQESSSLGSIDTTMDEYTDYSCSTSIERLARDVETILRKWHVVKGSDRHYSSHASNKTNKCLRSELVAWNLSFHSAVGNKITCDFDLELKLWDGPQPHNVQPLPTEGSADDGTVNSDLPYSLRQTSAPMTNYLNNWLDDFSGTFGIGQYLTLAPLHAACLSCAQTGKPLNPSYDALVDFLQQHSPAIQQHHNQQKHLQNLKQPPPYECIQSILTKMLQSAINLAAANEDCQFPVFGLWGKYQPAAWDNHNDNREIHALPDWARNPQSTSIHHCGPPSMPSPLISGRLLAHNADDDTITQCTFSCYTIQYQDGSKILRPPWTSWGNVLLQHCGYGDSNLHRFVHLRTARHTFCYAKQRPQRSLLWEAFGGEHHGMYDWRRATTRSSSPRQSSYAARGSTSSTAIDLTGSQQRTDMRLYRTQCQRHAVLLLEHALGASEKDPAWGPPDDPIESMQIVLQWNSIASMPLLTLPLQSRQDMTLQDIQEMEDATESAILDYHRPSTCFLKTIYDYNVAHASQAATQRCVLAALIQTATLPRETSALHLVDDNILEQWDATAGNRIAATLSSKANVDPTTKALVTAMDWSLAAEERIERWRAEDIVRRVFASNRAGFPQPPDCLVAYLIEHPHHIHDDGVWKPLSHSAPPGRLLSLLFLHMARVRSPSSMAMVWTVFCQELRRRWDARESLPNMHAVLALDPPTDKALCCFSSVGARGSLAAQINSSEPDPDSNYCLIGQKLQVFNLGLECMLIESQRHVLQREPGTETMDDGSVDSTPAALTDGTSVENPRSAKTILNGSFLDGMTQLDNHQNMDTDNHDESSRSDTHSQDFFDAEEGYNVRRGARCPVQGVTLVESDDQLYAPYLLRPYPLTEDIIAERKILLARQNTGPASTMIRDRLDIAQRFQRPKLFSDMCSFKAANPGAKFDDFVGWYGNPVDPFDNFNDFYPEGTVCDTKLDKAAEAILALEQTRHFWVNTWEVAVPVPAAEQNALFDAESTVEMALDYLENLHPSTLLCQVMAVNLSTSYFLLSFSAGETVRIRSVSSALDRLRATVDAAIRILAREVTNNISAQRTANGTPEMLTAVEAITACTKACEALATAEVIVSRAASFLHKLPQQYHLVEKIMTLPEGSALDLSNDEDGRSSFLETVHDQQRQFPGNHDKLTPAVREYVLVDDASHCRLVVRYGDEGINVLGKGRDGIVLGLTRIERDY